LKLAGALPGALIAQQIQRRIPTVLGNRRRKGLPDKLDEFLLIFGGNLVILAAVEEERPDIDGDKRI
jgi:hypothetical protein